MSQLELNFATAHPTKRFFVSMLTKDISLEDAILDLIDNCLDGALRVASGSAVDYSKHQIDITLSGKLFRIEDDCGGISRDIAANYAFKMGREREDERDSDIETLGMYGVGMKRALFKMGRSSIVRTLHRGDYFYISITPEWLDATGWDALPIQPSSDSDRPARDGTNIEVRELNASVSRQFENDGFINDLRTAIGEHFTLFIQKGLRISVNSTPVRAVRVEVLMSTTQDGPAPFYYQKVIDGVTVSIVIGLNTGRFIDEDDQEQTDFERSRSVPTAGWTVFCNDRAVIVGDKSRLTCWGDGAPLFHPQFSVITGVVEFRSSRADQLPITTTKRALDTASNVWLEARTKMREGLKVWTGYTNLWKNHPRSDQTKYWEKAIPMDLGSIAAAMNTSRAKVRGDSVMEYNPAKQTNGLPKPDDARPSSRRIVYSRPLEQIKTVSLFLYDRDDEKPGIVGDKCFEYVLHKAQHSDQ